MGLGKGNVNAVQNKADLRDELRGPTSQLRLVDKDSGSLQRRNEVHPGFLWIAPAFRKLYQASYRVAILFCPDVTVGEQRAASCVDVSHRASSSWRFFKRHCSEGGFSRHLQTNPRGHRIPHQRLTRSSETGQTVLGSRGYRPPDSVVATFKL